MGGAFGMFNSESEAFDNRVVADNLARVFSGRGIQGDININSASEGKKDRTMLYIGLAVAGVIGLYLCLRK